MTANQAAENKKKAIVIGASMAGLLAARVLADHYSEVTVLEKDIFPPAGLNRKSVPQGKHTHVLLEHGRQIMEKYLPGLTNDLINLGAVKIEDVSSNVAWFRSGGFHKQGVSSVSGIGVSRPTLEASVRARVKSISNIRILENCSVLGLITTNDNGKVNGVRFIDHQKSNTNEIRPAELVVDSSGRGSHSPAWLEKLGYKQPGVEEVRIGMGYVSCYFRRRPEHLPGLNGTVFLATPPNKRIGIILAQDKNRWVVTIGGYLGDHAPADFEGFLDAAKELPAPQIYNVIKNTKPLGSPVAYKFPANVRRHYEKLTRFPEGYLVFGDALCSFNPIYGQGMTVAAMEAAALGECLKDKQNNLAQNFFARARKIIDISWKSAVGSDLGYPEIKGTRTPLTGFFNWYIGKLHIAAHSDARVSIAFLKVINMISPPLSILSPVIIWRVVKSNILPEQKKTVVSDNGTDEQLNRFTGEQIRYSQEGR